MQLLLDASALGGIALLHEDRSDAWEWVKSVPFCWSGRCALLGGAGGDSDLDLYKGQSSRGLGSGSEAKGRGAGRGGRGGGRTERAQAGSCVFPRSDWVSCVLQDFGGGCGLGHLGGDLRVVTGASEGEPVEAGL